MFHEYDSVQAFVDVAETCRFRQRSFGFAWDGGVRYYEACVLARKGDPSLVGQCNYDLSKLSDYIESVPRARSLPAIAGSRVDIPAYLGGSPECMRKRAPVRTEQRQFRIYVDLISSAEIPASRLIARGKVILGLLEALQQCGINIELILACPLHRAFSGSEHHCLLIRVESNPLDLSTASFAIAHPAFARSLCYSVAQDVGGCHTDPRDAARYSQARMREQDLLEPGDLYIEPPDSRYDGMLADPEQWIARRLIQIADAKKA